MMSKKLLAIGRTAEIFLWEENRILKLFRDWCSPEWAQYEFKVSKIVQNAGLRVPAVFEIIELENRYGIIYERVDGSSMLQSIQAKPWKLNYYAHELAELQFTIHNQHVPELPSLRSRLEGRIQNLEILSSNEKEKILEILYDLPDDNQLCHGDFHPDNIIMTSKGPIIIDWYDATRGDPLADVARTSLMFQVATPQTDRLTRLLIKFFSSKLHRTYLNHYLTRSNLEKSDLSNWMLPVAAVRIDEGIPTEREKLLKLVQSLLE